MRFLPFFIAFLAFSGCYSFKGFSIPPEVNTFYSETFVVAASAAPPELGQNFTERLKDKVRRESRLVYDEAQPDIEFSGSVTQFTVTAEAPQPGELTAFNRLTISIAVEYVDNKDDSRSWRGNFSFFTNYPSDQNLLDIQDDLIQIITDQILEDIFNRAFNDW